MSCIYEYKGHKFKNEFELTDFLLETQQYESKYGDLVFELSNATLKTKDQVEKLAKESKELKKILDESVKTYGDGEIQEQLKRPYCGVTQFLSGLRNSKGDLFTPEFTDKYWTDQRYPAWKNGDFTDDEVETFFDSPDQAKPITNETDFQKYRNMMEDRWKQQAELGETVHSMFQLFFSKIKSGSKSGQLVASLSDKYLIETYYPSILKEATPTRKSMEDALKIIRTFKSQIEKKYGKCEYFPEISIMGETIQEVEGKGNRLLGRLDLLIIDENGNTHIVDYKTSTKSFNSQGSTIKGYSEAKKLTFIYQLAIYNRILQRYGVNVTDGDMIIVPVKFNNFKKVGNKYTYDGLSPLQPESKNKKGEIIPMTTWYSYKNTIETNIHINSNLNEYLPLKEVTDPVTEKLLSNTSEIMSDLFKSYKPSLLTNEEILDDLKKQKALTPVNGFYIYKIGSKEFSVEESKGEAELLKQVKDYYALCASVKSYTTNSIKSSLFTAIKNNTTLTDLPQIKNGEVRCEVNWLGNILRKYTNGNWKILHSESAQKYGIILLQNLSTGQIDVKRITTNNVIYLRHLGNNKSHLLTSGLQEDSIEDTNQHSLMLESRNGNMEMIETMLILQNMRNIFTGGGVLGSIEVLNPHLGVGMTASNEELVYSLNKLLEINHKIKTKDGKQALSKSLFGNQIKVCSKYQLALDQFHNIMTVAKTNKFEDEYKPYAGFETSLSEMDKAIDDTIDQKITALEAFIKQMESTDQWKKSLQSFEYSQDKLIQNYRELYNSAQIALSDLRGITFRQQVMESNQIYKSLNIFQHGIQGLYEDNPGNLESDTLNTITKQTMLAYQNVRDSMREPAVKLHQLIQNMLKNGSSYGITRNRANIFKNLYENPETVHGDFRFKSVNDATLTPAEKELLTYVLRLINKNRFGYSEEVCKQKEASHDVDYHRVPLAVGDTESIASVEGLLKSFKLKLKQFSPQNIKQSIENKVKGVGFAEDNDQLTKANTDLFMLSTIFDRGENSTERQNIINRTISKYGSIGYFEHNLEVLALKHFMAYSMKDNINKVFPIMKAAMAHLAYQGMLVNKPFTNDMNYIQDYIRNKIKNESIMAKNTQVAAEYVGQVKATASFLTLAFSPVQTLYQALQGLWNDIRLRIQKPDKVGPNDKSAFTFKNLSQAFTSAYRDLFAFGDTKTKNGLINEYYALNDMDMNQYVERISTQPKGIFNFHRFAMMFSSRPDFYNRLTIFGAQMRADGCWDAHSVKDGRLIYDWKKDKRFELFANDINVGSDEYNYQRALYYSMCEQFVNEHTMNPDGTEFKYTVGKKVDLPRAYTNQQAESMKSLADDIYGYYSHEKKAMLHATWLGSIFMQFKTFWTGKKNQYFGAGGVKLRGKFIQLTDENGNLLYHEVDENGRMLESVTTTKTAYPMIKWQGQWQEGIALTIASALSLNPIKTGQNIWSQWNAKDPQLRNAYRSNYKQLMFDVLLWGVIGPLVAGLLADWLKELKEESKIDPKPLKLMAATVLAKSINNSLLDFNIYDSFAKPICNWTPFAFSWLGRTLTNIYKTITFDQSIWDFMIKSFSFSNSIKDSLDLLVVSE